MSRNRQPSVVHASITQRHDVVLLGRLCLHEILGWSSLSYSYAGICSCVVWHSRLITRSFKLYVHAPSACNDSGSSCRSSCGRVLLDNSSVASLLCDIIHTVTLDVHTIAWSWVAARRTCTHSWQVVRTYIPEP